jgi:hypothetical protein
MTDFRVIQRVVAQAIDFCSQEKAMFGMWLKFQNQVVRLEVLAGHIEEREKTYIVSACLMQKFCKDKIFVFAFIEKSCEVGIHPRILSLYV